MFEKEGHHEADITPKEHSPENHCYYHTYHFTDDLSTITEAQVHQKLVETIQNVDSLMILVFNSCSSPKSREK